MRKLALCLLILVTVISLVACGNTAAPADNKAVPPTKQNPQPVETPKEEPEKTETYDNDKIDQMLDGSLNDEEVTVVGELIRYGQDKFETGILTTIEIQPNADNPEILFTCYYSGELEIELSEGDIVKVEGTCKGLLVELEGIKSIGLLVKNVEKIED